MSIFATVKQYMIQQGLEIVKEDEDSRAGWYVSARKHEKMIIVAGQAQKGKQGLMVVELKRPELYHVLATEAQPPPASFFDVRIEDCELSHVSTLIYYAAH